MKRSRQRASWPTAHPGYPHRQLYIELKDDDGFLGDRASKGAVRDILDKWRKPLHKSGEDPFGKEPSENISKKVLDAILIGDDTAAAAVVQSAIEDFAQKLAYVTRRFLKTKAWEKTGRIVVGTAGLRVCFRRVGMKSSEALSGIGKRQQAN